MARQIGGSGDYVNNTDANAGCSARGTGTTWTLILWFVASDNAAGSGFAALYAEDFAGDTSLSIQMNTNGTLKFFYRPGGFGQPTFTITSGGAYDDDIWHWLMFTCTADNAYEAFVDGVSVGTDTTSITQTATLNNTYIGAVGANQLPVGSRMARCANFKVALTLGEGAAFAYGQFVRHPNLWWELGIASTEPDWSGNGYSGTVNSSMPDGSNPPIGPWFGIDRGWQGEKEAVERLEKWFQQTYPVRHAPALVTY